MFKKSVVIRRRRVKLPDFEYKAVVLFSLFICGVIIGTMTVKGADSTLMKTLSELFSKYISARKDAAFLSNLCDSMLLCCVFPFMTFLLGLSAVGVPLIFAAPAIEGILLGTAVCYYYSAFGESGLGYCALAVIPAFTLVTGTLIKCCSGSSAMSLDILALVLGQKNEKCDINRLKKYCVSYLIMLIPLLASAFLHTGGFMLFGRLFGFVNEM